MTDLALESLVLGPVSCATPGALPFVVSPRA
jgi:hypothetical protein